MIQLLLSRNANVNATTSNGSTPLHEAAYAGHIMAANLLIEAKAMVNAETSTNHVTPLHDAAYNGHTALAAFLLRRGANINALTTSNRTPLHNASTAHSIHSNHQSNPIRSSINQFTNYRGCSCRRTC